MVLMKKFRKFITNGQNNGKLHGEDFHFSGQAYEVGALNVFS